VAKKVGAGRTAIGKTKRRGGRHKHENQRGRIKEEAGRMDRCEKRGKPGRAKEGREP